MIEFRGKYDAEVRRIRELAAMIPKLQAELALLRRDQKKRIKAAKKLEPARI